MNRQARLVWLAFLIHGCASRDDVLTSEILPAHADGGAASAYKAGMDGSIRPSDPLDGAAHDAADSGDGAVASPEICDGIDNDLDGIIDDVDVGHDGICDCLRIATLGNAGGSGKGDVFKDWLGTRSAQPVIDLAAATLTPQLLAGYQVIVAQDLHNIGRSYAASELDALEAWIRAGGGLMTLTGYASPDERTNANLILGRFGTNYGAQPILPRTSASTVPITHWVAHPVTAGVTQLGVDNGYEVQGNGRALASEQGYTLLRVQELGSGHLIAWGDEWITYDSEWNEHPDYQVAQFWVNAIKWLTVQKVCQVPAVPQ